MCTDVSSTEMSVQIFSQTNLPNINKFLAQYHQVNLTTDVEYTKIAPKECLYCIKICE